MNINGNKKFGFTNWYNKFHFLFIKKEVNN
jgi:hypothetical protein